MHQNKQKSSILNKEISNIFSKLHIVNYNIFLKFQKNSIIEYR